MHRRADLAVRRGSGALAGGQQRVAERDGDAAEVEQQLAIVGKGEQRAFLQAIAEEAYVVCAACDHLYRQRLAVQGGPGIDPGRLG